MIPTITLPATAQESRWVSVNDLRFFVKELEAKPESMMHQLALSELYELCGLCWDNEAQTSKEAK